MKKGYQGEDVNDTSQEKLTYRFITNSGPTHQNSGRRELRLGPLPVLETFGQRAVLPAWRDFEGTGDMLGRDASLPPLLNSRQPVLEGIHVAGRSTFNGKAEIFDCDCWQLDALRGFVILVSLDSIHMRVLY